MWEVLEEEMKKAGDEEKMLKKEDDDSFEEVSAIAVVFDPGWSKRTHKHT